jgi:hypothetical protein
MTRRSLHPTAGQYVAERDIEPMIRGKGTEVNAQHPRSSAALFYLGDADTQPLGAVVQAHRGQYANIARRLRWGRLGCNKGFDEARAEPLWHGTS